MNRLLVSGFLKRINLVVLLGCICISFGYKTKANQDIRVCFRNILGDTVKMRFKNKLVLTVINEPACTGCKVNLLQYMHTRSRIRQLYLLDWQHDIVSRKNYSHYIHELNSEAIEAYPLSGNEISLTLNDSLIRLTRDNSPYQLWISYDKQGLNIRKIPYKDIFESIQIKPEYFDQLKTF